MIVKGFIIQYKWSEQLEFSDVDLGDNMHTITHRQIEIDVPIHSLRFDPSDTATRDRIMQLQLVKALEKEKVDKLVEIQHLDQRIHELLALESPNEHD